MVTVKGNPSRKPRKGNLIGTIIAPLSWNLREEPLKEPLKEALQR